MSCVALSLSKGPDIVPFNFIKRTLRQAQGDNRDVELFSDNKIIV